jgi:hypothetical protein
VVGVTVFVTRSGVTAPALTAATVYVPASVGSSGDHPTYPVAAAVAGPSVAAAVFVAVAFADNVAAVPDATAAIVVFAATPVPVTVRPTSSLENVPAGPVTAADPDVFVSDATVRPSVVRPATIS